MTKILELNISGLRTISEANSREHWAKKHKRAKMQKNAVTAFWNLSPKGVSLPCHVKLTRIAPRALDEGDNLPASFKHIRDALADLIKPGHRPGMADSKGDISWEYAQCKEKPKYYAIKIEIFKK